MVDVVGVMNTMRTLIGSGQTINSWQFFNENEFNTVVKNANDYVWEGYKGAHDSK